MLLSKISNLRGQKVIGLKHAQQLLHVWTAVSEMEHLEAY